MTSAEYRQIIRLITKNVLNKKFPGLKKNTVEETAADVAKNIHARMYGANVDGVDSPIWSLGRGIDRGNRYKEVEKKNQPNVEAKDLLNG